MTLVEIQLVSRGCILMCSVESTYVRVFDKAYL